MFRKSRQGTPGLQFYRPLQKKEQSYKKSRVAQDRLKRDFLTPVAGQ